MKWTDICFFLSIFSFLIDKDVKGKDEQAFIKKQCEKYKSQHKSNQDGTINKNDVKVKKVKKFKRNVDNWEESKY